jgi:hypothetical protein
MVCPRSRMGEGFEHTPAPLVWVVMAGHSASEDARERAYVPAIHVFFLGEKAVDARHKAGHDGGSSDPV